MVKHYGKFKKTEYSVDYQRQLRKHITKDKKPKYHTIFVIQGNYGQGWEDLTEETLYSEAHDRLREYNENEKGYSHRLIRRREKG